jgi:hypothetical protein
LLRPGSLVQAVRCQPIQTTLVMRGRGSTSGMQLADGNLLVTLQ